MAAVAAVVARRRASEKRRQAQQAAEDAKSFVKDTLERFDKDHSGGLKWSEVKTFLEALQAGKRDGDLSVHEIRWVIQEAIKSTETEEEWEKWANGSKQLQGTQLEKAALAFVSYLSHYQEIDSVFQKFHHGDPAGSLSKNEITLLLTELNDGVAPTEIEVARVLRHAERNPPDVGMVSKPGLIKALSEWYAIEEEKHPPPSHSSSCCVIS